MNQIQTSSRPRNLAIDFFRGWALIVIFINHVPTNEWMLYTPSRFGFSDASEIFVFLSGYAAALSYGRRYHAVGLGLTSLATTYRCVQLYVCHLGLFLALSSICALANETFIKPDYIGKLNLHYFFDQTPEALLYLVTLRYLPNFFDILPLYIVVLMGVPLLLEIRKYWPGMALIFPVLLYFASWYFNWHLSADPHSQRTWFFNPFPWQFMFFSGFAIASGWVKIPESKYLLWLCSMLIILAMPLSYPILIESNPYLREVRQLLEPFLDKTNLGPLRWLHLITMALLIRAGLQSHPELLTHWFAKGFIKMGQQALPIFLTGMVLSFLGGIVLDQFGHAAFVLIIVNIGGILLLTTLAYVIGWLDTKPWKQYRYQPEVLENCVTVS
jgi:hypothetical protein